MSSTTSTTVRGGVPYADPNAMADALVAAAADAGIRITLLDACYLRGGPGIELDPVQQRFSDGTVEQWATRVDRLRPAPHAAIGAAVHSTRAVAPDDIATVAAWAAARGAPLHAHVSEQPAENEHVLAAHGATPVGLLAAAGALDERFTAVHATHLTADDVNLLGAARCTCCICPTTERDLADGIGPTIALREAGARLTLGSDSHAVIDMLEEARAVELDERLTSLRRGGHEPAALLRMATADGHASIGWPDAGRIEVGARADLDVGAPRLGAHRRDRTARRRRRRRVRGDAPPTCTTSSSTAGSSCATAATRRSTSPPSSAGCCGDHGRHRHRAARHEHRARRGARQLGGLR